MLNEILPFYNQELTHIRDLAEEFAKAYPKIASHLRLGPGEIEDPHVARLIESFAFLTAHIRHKLEDDFPALAEALLSMLYPHYQAPIPAFSLIQFECKPEITTGHVIPKQTLIETTPNCSEYCQFNTVYPVTLLPIKIAKTVMDALPLQAPLPPTHFGKIESTLRLSLRCSAEKMTFSKLAPTSLQFYIDAQKQHVHQLYEFIFKHAVGLAIASYTTDQTAIFLDQSYIKTVGFEKEDSLLPYSAHASLGYRLLTEFFVFPEKFLFFKIDNLDEKLFEHIDNELEIFIYFDSLEIELVRNINVHTFKLGCTPVINLFSQIAEPIALTHKKTDYRVIPDARRLFDIETYSIEKVSALTSEGKEVSCLPFYSSKYHQQDQTDNYFWYAKRKTRTEMNNIQEEISDFYLSFTDLDFHPDMENEGVIHVETLVTNGNTPSRLPVEGKEFYLQLCSEAASLKSIHVLMPFTKTIRPSLREGARWKLISHLSLNHFSLSDQAEGIEALKNILKLYSFNHSNETNRIINGLLNIKSRLITARSLHNYQNALSQGIEITIHLDESQFMGSGKFLFMYVLEHFMAEYATINSFTKLIVTSIQKEGILYQWPPRLGNKVLL